MGQRILQLSRLGAGHANKRHDSTIGMKACPFPVALAHAPCKARVEQPRDEQQAAHARQLALLIGPNFPCQCSASLLRSHVRKSALPGRLELPTLRLTASRSNQLSYGSK